MRNADPTLALRDIESLEGVIGSSLAPRRFALALATCFAVLALVLAAIGINGDLAFIVADRTRELGVRLALGATPGNLVARVFRQGMRCSSVGLATGIAGALAGARLLTGMLYGVTPVDSGTCVAIVFATLLVVGVSCIAAAMRVTRVDPIRSIRGDQAEEVPDRRRSRRSRDPRPGKAWLATATPFRSCQPVAGRTPAGIPCTNSKRNRELRRSAAGRVDHRATGRGEARRVPRSGVHASGAPMRRPWNALFVVATMAAGCGKDASGPDVAAPVLSALSPDRGTVGTEVRIDGAGFTARVTVRFGDVESPRVIRQGGSLFAIAPAGLVAGRQYAVHVLNDGVRADTSKLVFTAVPPLIDRVNGVTKPTGLRGMTLILEGAAFSDSVGLSSARVYFSGAGGAKLPAVVSDTSNDWADRFVVTTVPQEIGDVSWIWIETPTGVSDSVEFRIIQSGLFSPSLINWSKTTTLPQALHALGAVFVPIEDGSTPANWVFVTGGADSVQIPVSRVSRAAVEQNGALSGSWSDMPALPAPRAYHASVAATPFTAALDTSTTGAFLYVIGGLDAAGQPTTTVYVARVALDGSVQPWQATTALPQALRSPSATIFAGWIYVVGGANAQGMAVRSAWRAPVSADGTVGAWQAMADLPAASSHAALVSFGPFLYSIGGETLSTTAIGASQSGSETSNVFLARIDLRSRNLTAAGWSTTASMGKARSKHGAIFAGGSVFVTSGIYAGNPGSSENTYAAINSDGALGSWNGATGSETIDVELGMSLYNQAVVTFIDDAGSGHVLVLGGADRKVEGRPTAGVVRY